MRLRIQTNNPLPEIKAWFIPDVQITTSVYDLKEALCLRFQALKARKFRGKDLILLLDDFELLNDSPFSAVRDGDLICVKLSPLAQVEDVEMDIKIPVVRESNMTRQRKRKRSQSPLLPIPGRSVRESTVQPSLKRKATPSSEEDDTDSDTSSATSSSSTSSSSSSSSSSSTSSLSSSVSPPKPSTSQRTQQAVGTKPAVDNVTSHSSSSRLIPLVPPGLGKPSTHSRNKRRRLKKDYEKEALLADTPRPPKGSSLTNNLPLGQRKSKPGPSSHPPSHTNPLLSDKSSTLETNAQGGDISTFPSSSTLPEHLQHENISDSHTPPNQLMMGSLRNKNKKKGFKQSMANPLPQKIIFTSNTTASVSQPPPSLPAQDKSMDVPSISPGTIQPRLIPPSEIQELGQLPSNMFVTSVDVESDIWSDHKKQTLEFSKPFDWDRLERLWEECAVLEKLEQLVVGCLVGWKALAINPQTFSPEMLLMVARVVNTGQESAPSTTHSTQSIVVRYLQRPGAGRAALAFGLNGRFNDEEQVEEDEEDNETFEWTDVLRSQWRVIKV